MKPHWHTGIDHALILAVEVALIFHGFRFLAGKLAEQKGTVGKVGESVGGVFSFGGLH